jgi:hypothetical protein
MKHLTALLAIYCFALLDAHAEITEYDFELIIFEDTSGRYANSEQWNNEFPETSTVDTASPGNQSNNTDTSAVMKISQIEGIGLKKYANKLKSSKRYNVLVHKAWRQSGFSDNATIDIPIDSRPKNNARGKQSPQRVDANDIHGSIKIVLGRYLHIYTDMIYQQPRKDNDTAWDSQTSQQYKEYPINFHRRMRSKELHYLDHPLVGILVMAKPVKKQEASQEST